MKRTACEARPSAAQAEVHCKAFTYGLKAVPFRRVIFLYAVAAAGSHAELR